MVRVSVPEPGGGMCRDGIRGGIRGGFLQGTGDAKEGIIFRNCGILIV